jgi:disulfide bond formation protein DsbB
MDIQGVIFLYGVLAVVGVLVLAWFGLMFVAARFSDGVAASYHDIRVRLTPLAITGAWGVATLAMAGSLYFSETANFPPCQLCWYQRIAMYPLVLILGVAALRRDTSVRWYAIPLALVGAAIAAYHLYVQWFSVELAGCAVDAPCHQAWFREFGFISIPFLALVAFLLVVVFLLIPLRQGDEDPDDEDEDAGDAADEAAELPA